MNDFVTLIRKLNTTFKEWKRAKTSKALNTLPGWELG